MYGVGGVKEAIPIISERILKNEALMIEIAGRLQGEIEINRQAVDEILEVINEK